VNAETVRRQMGHRDITTTLRHYAHAMPGDDAAVSAAIGDGMTGKIA
jgi:integrase